MAARKRPRKAAVAPLVRRKPPAVYVQGEAPNGGEEVYVRLPLAPDVVAAIREHAANGTRLLELFTGTDAAAAEVLAQINKTAVALGRDVAKVRAQLKRRRQGMRAKRDE